ncbi:MAG: hypothetical protein MHM6MM_005386 [Cercozoa sp. M6MM]
MLPQAPKSPRGRAFRRQRVFAQPKQRVGPTLGIYEGLARDLQHGNNESQSKLVDWSEEHSDSVAPNAALYDIDADSADIVMDMPSSFGSGGRRRRRKRRSKAKREHRPISAQGPSHAIRIDVRESPSHSTGELSFEDDKADDRSLPSKRGFAFSSSSSESPSSLVQVQAEGEIAFDDIEKADLVEYDDKIGRTRSEQTAPPEESPSRKEPSLKEPSLSRKEPSEKGPSQMEPSQMESSRMEPSRTEPSRKEPSLSRKELSREEPGRIEAKQPIPEEAKRTDREGGAKIDTQTAVAAATAAPEPTVAEAPARLSVASSRSVLEPERIEEFDQENAASVADLGRLETDLAHALEHSRIQSEQAAPPSVRGHSRRAHTQSEADQEAQRKRRLRRRQVRAEFSPGRSQQILYNAKVRAASERFRFSSLVPRKDTWTGCRGVGDVAWSVTASTLSTLGPTSGDGALTGGGWLAVSFGTQVHFLRDGRELAKRFDMRALTGEARGTVQLKWNLNGTQCLCIQRDPHDSLSLSSSVVVWNSLTSQLVCFEAWTDDSSTTGSDDEDGEHNEHTDQEGSKERPLAPFRIAFAEWSPHDEHLAVLGTTPVAKQKASSTLCELLLLNTARRKLTVLSETPHSEFGRPLGAVWHRRMTVLAVATDDDVVSVMSIGEGLLAQAETSGSQAQTQVETLLQLRVRHTLTGMSFVDSPKQLGISLQQRIETLRKSNDEAGSMLSIFALRSGSRIGEAPSAELLRVDMLFKQKYGDLLAHFWLDDSHLLVAFVTGRLSVFQVQFDIPGRRVHRKLQAQELARIQLPAPVSNFSLVARPIACDTALALPQHGAAAFVPNPAQLTKDDELRGLREFWSARVALFAAAGPTGVFVGDLRPDTSQGTFIVRRVIQIAASDQVPVPVDKLYALRSPRHENIVLQKAADVAKSKQQGAQSKSTDRTDTKSKGLKARRRSEFLLKSTAKIGPVVGVNFVPDGSRFTIVTRSRIGLNWKIPWWQKNLPAK